VFGRRSATPSATSGCSLPPQVTAVFGDVRVDLRALRTACSRLELSLGTVFGDRRVEPAPVPRLAGTPPSPSSSSARSSVT
jgi:hypothetical protein